MFSISGPHALSAWSWRISPAFLPKGAKFTAHLEVWPMGAPMHKEKTQITVTPEKRMVTFGHVSGSKLTTAAGASTNPIVTWHRAGNPPALSTIELEWRPRNIPPGKRCEHRFNVSLDLYGNGKDVLPDTKGVTVTGHNGSAAVTKKAS